MSKDKTETAVQPANPPVEVEAEVRSVAPVPPTMAMKPYQPTLFNVAQFLGPNGAVFGVKETLDSKTQVRNGYVLAPGKRVDVANNLGLSNTKENREAIDKAILEASDNMLQNVKGTMAKLPSSWTLARLQAKVTKQGESMTIRIKNVKRVADELLKYAQAHGFKSIEEMDSFMEAKKAKVQSNQ